MFFSEGRCRDHRLAAGADLRRVCSRCRCGAISSSSVSGARRDARSPNIFPQSCSIEGARRARGVSQTRRAGVMTRRSFSRTSAVSRPSRRRSRPKRSVRLLNEYMTPMTDTVFQAPGHARQIYRRRGHGFFGARRSSKPDHALRACRAALEMQEQTSWRLNRTFRRAGTYRASEIGIGLSSGPMTIGNMGSDDHFRVHGPRRPGESRRSARRPNQGLWGGDSCISEASYRRRRRRHALSSSLASLRVKGKVGTRPHLRTDRPRTPQYKQGTGEAIRRYFSPRAHACSRPANGMRPIGGVHAGTRVARGRPAIAPVTSTLNGA